jgi:hypothetical protein
MKSRFVHSSGKFAEREAGGWPLRIGVLFLGLSAMAAAISADDRAPAPRPPGVVISHSPASSGQYIGSPGLAVLPGGAYMASHDLFGPKSSETVKGRTRLFRSDDKGQTWKHVSDIHGQYWSSLFVHRGALYLFGTDRHSGSIVIRRSTDGGVAWTEPRDSATGLLTPGDRYHTAPMPVLEHNGRLWRAFEDTKGGTQWGESFRAGMLSIPVEADLLRATNWTFSNFLPRDPQWLGGKFNGWLEGNAVLTREGHVVNMLRVDTPDCPEKAAIVRLSEDGRTASFDAAADFVDLPGGAKKFSIRHDRHSDLYWSLATVVPAQLQTAEKPASVRNSLALICSRDLGRWETRCVLLHHPDTARHGFQYVDWLFAGDDLIAACRTAYDDEEGGAHNFHDANFLTFHRFKNFRQFMMKDSAASFLGH